MLKKIILIISAFMLMLLAMQVSTNAAELSTFAVSTTKTDVMPGQNIKVKIDFGEQMSKYTLVVAYDSNIFEYSAATGGDAIDNGNNVTVEFEDLSTLSQEASVTFKTKTDLITTIPTDFSVTATDLQNFDGSEMFSDILIPVVSNVIVTPEYKDYEMDFIYEGTIIAEEQKDMTLKITSELGENFNQTRIIAEAVTPLGESVKLMGIDNDNEEFDLIQNGYGDPSGDQIGGVDVVKEINVKGIFSAKGEYSVTFKLINRDDLDNVIVEKTVVFNVDEKEEELGAQEEKEEEVANDEEVVEIPEELPQTGNTQYLQIMVYLIMLISIYGFMKVKIN